MFDKADDEVAVWSDLHLGHANILRYEDRPFKDVQSMDGYLWQRWEDIASESSISTVVVVGDTAMNSALNAGMFSKIRAMPCDQYLAVGNHDLTGLGEVRVNGFDVVCTGMLSLGDPPLVWTHYPLAEVPDGMVNVHGHIHSNQREGPYINVSVEQLDFRPVSLRNLRILAKALVQGHTPNGTTTIERIRLVGNRLLNPLKDGGAQELL